MTASWKIIALLWAGGNRIEITIIKSQDYNKYPSSRSRLFRMIRLILTNLPHVQPSSYSKLNVRSQERNKTKQVTAKARLARTKHKTRRRIRREPCEQVYNLSKQAPTISHEFLPGERQPARIRIDAFLRTRLRLLNMK